MRKITLFLALMVAMVTTAFAVTPAEEVTVTKTKVALTTEEGQPGYVSSPHDHAVINPNSPWDKGGVAALIDGNVDTHFHTAWENVPVGPHYFEVDMGENNSIGKFCFDYVSRKDGTDDWAREFTIKGSNDKSDFELITVVDFGSEAKKGSSHTSEVLGSDEKTYRYLRFEVTNTNMQPAYSYRTYFHAAEFALYTVKEEAAVEPEEPEATEGIDTSKEYYLYSSWNWGMNNGYLTIGTKSGSNYGVVCMSNNKQAFKLTPSGDGYTISRLADMGGMSYTEYINCDNSDNVGNNAMSGSVLFLEKNTNGKYYIKNNRGGYFKIEMVSYGTDGSGYHVFSNGAMTDAAEWELVAVAAEPEAPAAEPLTYVSHTPNTPVERITEISIVFSKDVQAVNGMIKLKNGGNVTTAFSSTEAVINGSTVTYYLMSPVKNSGDYTLEFPAESVVATDGGMNAEAIKLTITVEAAAAAPTFKSSSFGPKVNYTNCYSLEEIKVEFSENIEIASDEALELKNGEEVVATITDIEVEGKSLCLYLDEPLTNEVATTYSIVIPAGYVKTAGTELALASDVTINNIKVAVPFVIKNITPANGETVEAIENIVIECNNAIFDYNYNNYIKLKNTADGSEIAIAKEDYAIDGNVLTITPSAAIPNGTYTLVGLANITNTSYSAVYSVPEYTITVAAPLYEANEVTVTFTPENGYSCEYIKLGFAEVVEVVGAGPYAVVYNAEGEVVTEITTYTQASLAAYRKNATFNLAEKITAAGTYTVKFNAAIIKGTESGKVYAGGEYEFTVTKRPVEITTVDAPWGNVEEVYPDYQIVIQYADEVTVDTEKAVTMTVGEETYTATLTTEDGSWGYTISIVFNAEFANGDYTFTIPAGLYTVNGVENEAEVYEFTYAAKEPLKVVSITPAAGAVESISEITIEFSAPVVCEYSIEFAGCVFMQADYTWQPRQTVTFIAMDYETGEYATITEAGEYVFDLLNAVEWGTKLADDQDRYITWTIGETTAIDAVDAEAENAVIYDLTGRRVEKITKAGIYVINGVKKVVK